MTERRTTCSVCGGYLGDVDPHYPHEAGCPRGRDPLSDAVCTCDLIAHPWCCGDCAREEWALRSDSTPAMTIKPAPENYLMVAASTLPDLELSWFVARRGGRVAVAEAGEDTELHDRPTLSALVEQAALAGYDGVAVE